MRKGFTLAETLITIGIIGIVAAMTLPALIHNYRKQQVESKLKSTYVILNQLFERTQLDNGKIDSWERYGTITSHQQFYEKYILPYINGRNQCQNNSTTRVCSTEVYSADGKNYINKGMSLYDTRTKILLPNNVGIVMTLPHNTFGADTSGTRIGIYLDLNISPDKIRSGIDFFELAALKASINDFTYIGAVKPVGSSNKTTKIYLPRCDSIANSDYVMSDGTKLNAKDLCHNDIDDRYGYGQIFCAALIQCNGWKIPDNYPIKL